MEFAVMRGYEEVGRVDPNAQSTLNNAKAQGFFTDVYHYPCLNKAASTQASELTSSISGFGIVWIDVEGTWGSDKNWNC